MVTMWGMSWLKIKQLVGIILAIVIVYCGLFGGIGTIANLLLGGEVAW